MSASRKTAEKPAAQERLIEVYHFEDEPHRLGHRIGLERYFATQLAISGRDITSNEDDEWVDEITFQHSGSRFRFRYVLYDDFTRMTDKQLLSSKLHIIDLLINGDKHKGFELHAKLEKLGYPHDRIVFVTGFKEEVTTHFKGEPPAEVLEKPVSVADMLDLLWRAIRDEFG